MIGEYHPQMGVVKMAKVLSGAGTPQISQQRL